MKREGRPYDLCFPYLRFETWWRSQRRGWAFMNAQQSQAYRHLQRLGDIHRDWEAFMNVPSLYIVTCFFSKIMCTDFSVGLWH